MRPTGLVVSPLLSEDRSAWEPLARAYKAFYETELPKAEYEKAWNRLLARDGVAGIGAKVDGELVGFAHYLFHSSVWASKVCYLQDLFVAPEARSKGIARALIEAVAAASREAGAKRYYWLTREGNAGARALYDKVANFNGFVRYDYPL